MYMTRVTKEAARLESKRSRPVSAGESAEDESVYGADVAADNDEDEEVAEIVSGSCGGDEAAERGGGNAPTE